MVGYAIGGRPNSELVVRALTKAVESHHPVRITICSDMGSVFESEHYRKVIHQVGITQSMGNAGLSFANQMIESFFGKIKTELLHNCPWSTYE